MTLVAVGVIVLLTGWLAAGTLGYVNASIQSDLDLTPDSRVVEFDEPTKKQLAERREKKAQRAQPVRSPDPWDLSPNAGLLQGRVLGVNSRGRLRLQLQNGGLITVGLAGVEPLSDARIARKTDGEFEDYPGWLEAELKDLHVGYHEAKSCSRPDCMMLFKSGELLNLKLVHLGMARPVPGEVGESYRGAFRRAAGPGPVLASSESKSTARETRPEQRRESSASPADGGTTLTPRSEPTASGSSTGDSHSGRNRGLERVRKMDVEQLRRRVRAQLERRLQRRSEAERDARRMQRFDVSELSPVERERLMRVRNVLGTIMRRLSRRPDSPNKG